MIDIIKYILKFILICVIVYFLIVFLILFKKDDERISYSCDFLIKILVFFIKAYLVLMLCFALLNERY